MNTDLVRHEISPVDSWVEVLGAVGDLATKVAETAFVPVEMKGNPAAIAAAILTGRELGIGPMTALQHIHVVKGKPGLSAQLMRSLILSAGHELRYLETTDTRCVVEGRRKGEPDWTRVSFTADQAKKASIQLGTYPEDKLVARATSRLARRVFADAIGGLAYTVDELEDADQGAAPGVPTAGRTARRTTRQATAVRTDSPADPTPEKTPVVVDQPPLDNEPASSQQETGEAITKPQSQKLHALFNDVEWTDREDRLRAASIIVGRPLESSNDLTKTEASQVIEVLVICAAAPDPQVRLAEILEAAEIVEAELVTE